MWSQLTDKKSGIQTEQLKLEADLGPIKYVAEFICYVFQDTTHVIFGIITTIIQYRNGTGAPYILFVMYFFDCVFVVVF